MKYANTTLKVAVHLPNDNPVFGINTTHVEVCDEAGGGYLILTQFPDEGTAAIKVDIEELEEITKVARQLIDNYDKAIRNSKRTVSDHSIVPACDNCIFEEVHYASPPCNECKNWSAFEAKYVTY